MEGVPEKIVRRADCPVASIRESFACCTMHSALALAIIAL